MCLSAVVLMADFLTTCGMLDLQHPAFILLSKDRERKADSRDSSEPGFGDGAGVGLLARAGRTAPTAGEGAAEARAEHTQTSRYDA